MVEAEEVIPSFPMPPAIARLPRDARGYPTPFFVATVNGERSDLRIADVAKRELCFKQDLCWVCGTKLEKLRVFVGGPCACHNRVFGDWASHVLCAEYALHVCPFLNGEMARRSGRDYPEQGRQSLAGHVDELPTLVGLYYTSRPTERTEEGHFLAGAPRWIWYYKDTVKVSTQEAAKLNAPWIAKQTEKMLEQGQAMTVLKKQAKISMVIKQ